MKEKITKNLEVCSAILLGFLPMGLIIGTAISETIIALINISFIIIFFIKKNYLLIKKKEIIHLGFIWIYLLINCIAAINPELSLTRSIFFFRYILLILSISNLFKEKSYQKIIFTIWSITIVVVTIDICYEFFLGRNTLGYVAADRTRIVSFMRDELRIGGLVLAFFLFVISFWNILIVEKKISLKFKIFFLYNTNFNNFSNISNW